MRYLPLLLLPLLYFLFVRKTKVNRIILGEKINFLEDYKMRGCDDWGCGHYGAKRTNSNGSYNHRGVDLVFKPSMSIMAPFDCIIIRVGKPYANSNYSLIEIKGVNEFKNFTAKCMYVTDFKEPSNKIYKQGDFLCKCDNIALRYPNITNHMHFELYGSGILVNPENYK